MFLTMSFFDCGRISANNMSCNLLFLCLVLFKVYFMDFSSNGATPILQGLLLLAFVYVIFGFAFRTFPSI